MLDQHLIVKPKATANENQIYSSGKLRLTVITPELLRVEICEQMKHCYEPTQIVWYRDFGKHKFDISFNEKYIIVETEAAKFFYNIKKEIVDLVEIDGKKINPLKDNLKGTARTLDFTNGSAKYDDGVVGRYGVATMVDDSLIIDENGEVKERVPQKDYYVFATKKPQDALNLLYALTGAPPMIPRYAVGNWWSRYYDYEQEEYLKLMDRFKKEGFKFTVATVDMDWHVVDVKKEFGYKGREGAYMVVVVGWTGYTWNKKLFPDYKQFLKDLKERNLHTTLNVHPAGGVRCFEEQYEDVAKAVGQDSSEKKAVKFDITNPMFLNAYFKYLHRPYEEDGVDFWWIDWQQGKKSKLKGYDPLWACNHYHYLDNKYFGKRPMILSRYSGIGSHRYPVGFSGDTRINWKSLALQPDFTAQAANVGYTTWSHDICGHMGGKSEDDELYLRWIQFGVFSPILRLHSTKDRKFFRTISKEPWNHMGVYEDTRKFLNLRHALIPYVYTAYYQNYKNGVPICKPMYYEYPNEDMAYSVKNQYYFGSELIACPITSPMAEDKFARRMVWVPKGKVYIDFFTGEKLEEGYHEIKSPLNHMPVYAVEGSIIPMAITEGNEWENPKSMHIKVYPGNNTYELYEDASVTEAYQDGENVITKLSVSKEKGKVEFKIEASVGKLELIPASRNYKIEIYELEKYIVDSVKVAGKQGNFSQDEKSISLEKVDTSKDLVITLTEK